MVANLNKDDARDARLRLAMTSAGIGLAIVDLQGRWLEVNPAAEQALGQRAADLVGQPMAAITHPDDMVAFSAALGGLLNGDIPVLDAQQRYLRHDGDPVWMHVNVAVMRDPQGAPTSLVVHLRDLTGEREAAHAQQALQVTLQRRLDRQGDDLQALNQQQESFAYGISHDLRTPLRAIDGYAALLADHPGATLDDSARGYLQRIRGASNSMTGLIESLLDLSHVNRAPLKPEAVDMSMLAGWIGAELQDADPDRRADIRVAPGLHAHGDERQLKLLLAKLLGNAWKFSRDCEQVQIQVDGQVRDGRLLLQVRDHGAGFDMRYADKLYQPFQRLHGPEQGGGSGLGLAIARRIVERHHGRLWAQSETGAGSTFHVELPAAAEND